MLLTKEKSVEPSSEASGRESVWWPWHDFDFDIDDLDVQEKHHNAVDDSRPAEV